MNDVMNNNNSNKQTLTFFSVNELKLEKLRNKVKSREKLRKLWTGESKFLEAMND